MSKNFKRLLVICGICLVISGEGYSERSAPPLQDEDQICESTKGLSHCVIPGEPGTHQVLVYLHGFSLTERSWVHNAVTRQVTDGWKSAGIKRPHILSLSQGRSWWYDSKAVGDLLTQRLKDIQGRFFPEASEVILYGDSMGGHNALRWASDFPELFDRMILLCPAVPLSFIGLPPDADGTWPFNEGVQILFEKIYPDPQDRFLEKAFDFEQLKKLKSFFIAATPKDHYGFFLGNQKLAQVLRASVGNKAQVIVDVQEVRHCLIQADQLNRFLSE